MAAGLPSTRQSRRVREACGLGPGFGHGSSAFLYRQAPCLSGALMPCICAGCLRISPCGGMFLCGWWSRVISRSLAGGLFSLGFIEFLLAVGRVDLAAEV